MSPAEKRLKTLKNLKELEEGLPNPDPNYIADLKLSIKQLRADIKNSSPIGYKMVEV